MGVTADEAVVAFRKLGTAMGGSYQVFSRGGYISNTISTKHT
jgi:hypothetical protein